MKDNRITRIVGLYDIRWKLNLVAILIVLPLLGPALTRIPIGRYLEFPPVTHYVLHADFSWAAFIALALAILAVLIPFLLRILSSQRRIAHEPTVSKRPFPLWGWGGVALTVIAWTMAWTRFSWFSSLQTFTFAPIWLGYIVVINALTYKRTGHCMLRDRPRYVIGLFFLSALFWWYFEYLNRFVQNWYYHGIGHLSRMEYFIFATLPFSTVLPAVLGTEEFLASLPRASAGLNRFVKIRFPHPRILAWIPLLGFAASLAAIGIWPDYLFPLLWVSPLFIITALQALRGEKTIFARLADGNWQRLFLLAMSALICGFLWELWNFRSMAKWIYAVPFVNKFRIFEMPILGYAGYLPFGLECAVVAEVMLQKRRERTGSFDPATLTPARRANVCRYGNTIILIAIALYLFIAPGLLVIRDLSDPQLGGEGIPDIAWRLHRDLTPRYGRWARERVASGKAAEVHLYNVPETEWPMFGSVYYLWATESLQEAWEQDNSLSREAPSIYAREAIEAAADLIVDPSHHTWVKTHWGDDYMHDENVFFRSLIIAGLTSYEKLIGDGKHVDLLRDQVETLAAELDASPHGVLEDYPNECYPIDVFAAIALIRRADAVLGTDHRSFVARASRAFEGEMLDKRGLIPYLVDDETGELLAPSRGVGNSYTLIFAPELWPERAEEWYRLYEQYFWQRRMGAAGFREYPRNIDSKFDDYFDLRIRYDVDAGPIVAGFSPAANAFGLAGARINGRLDHAYTLGSQIMVATWPLLDGSLLGPQLLSSREHAPYLGEACMLFFFSQRPAPHVEIVKGGHMPAFVYGGLLFYLGTGLLLILVAARNVRKWRRAADHTTIPYQAIQVVVWSIAVLAGIALLVAGHGLYGLIVFLFAQIFPRFEVGEVRPAS